MLGEDLRVMSTTERVLAVGHATYAVLLAVTTRIGCARLVAEVTLPAMVGAALSYTSTITRALLLIAGTYR